MKVLKMKLEDITIKLDKVYKSNINGERFIVTHINVPFSCTGYVESAFVRLISTESQKILDVSFGHFNKVFNPNMPKFKAGDVYVHANGGYTLLLIDNFKTVLETVSFDLGLVELDTYTFISDYKRMNTESQISRYKDYNKRNSTYDAKHNANLIKLGVL